MLAYVIVALTLGQSPAPVDASALKIDKPARVGEVDAGKLGGEPTKLAWSPDGQQFYLEATERKKDGSAILRHFVFPVSGGSPQSVNAAPDWAAAYWALKSQQAAPGAPALKIELTDEKKPVRATAAPMGGDMARGGTGTGAGEGSSLGEATAAAAQTEMQRVITLRLNGHVIGEFINGPLVPGLTFGWSNETLGLIAFTDPKGRVMIMDRAGNKSRVPDVDNAILPAWSGDGTKVAFLERDGRRKYIVLVAPVAR